MQDVGGEDRPISDALLRLLDYIAPNESELARLTGLPTSTEAEVLAAAASLRARGARSVLVTLGARGALLLTADGSVLRQASLEVPGAAVVDATAAGDAFRAAFAVALVEGRPLHDCLRFASAAGSLAVTRMGAVPSLPHRAETERLASGQASSSEASASVDGDSAAAAGSTAATGGICGNAGESSAGAGACSAAAASAATPAVATPSPPSRECPYRFASRLNSMHARRDLAGRADGADNVLGWVSWAWVGLAMISLLGMAGQVMLVTGYRRCLQATDDAWMLCPVVTCTPCGLAAPPSCPSPLRLHLLTCVPELQIKRQSRVRGLSLVDLNHPQHTTAAGLKPKAVLRALAEAGLGAGAVCMRFPAEEYALGALSNPDVGVQQRAVALAVEGCRWAAELGARDLILWTQFDGYDYHFQVCGACGCVSGYGGRVSWLCALLRNKRCRQPADAVLPLYLPPHSHTDSSPHHTTHRWTMWPPGSAPWWHCASWRMPAPLAYVHPSSSSPLTRPPATPLCPPPERRCCWRGMWTAPTLGGRGWACGWHVACLGMGCLRLLVLLPNVATLPAAACSWLTPQLPVAPASHWLQPDARCGSPADGGGEPCPVHCLGGCCRQAVWHAAQRRTRQAGC